MTNIENRISDLVHSYSSCGMKEEYEGTLNFAMAALCHYQNPKGKEVKRRHQRQHVSNALLNEYAERLSMRKADLEKCSNFESLMAIVYDEKISGIGPVTLYDAGSAIGYILQPRVLPMKFVYLHAGVAKGYKALANMGMLPKSKEKRVPIEVFSCLEELKRLNSEKHKILEGATFSMLVEDFLCVKHKELEFLAAEYCKK